jgi:hypothetical protein
MPEFKITKKITNGHQHVLYLRDDGIGFASEENGHVPVVQQVAVVDPNSGEQTMQWVVVDPNGTQHEITDIPVSEKRDNQKKEDIVKEVLEDFTECYEYERESRMKAAEAEQIYSHDENWYNKIKPDNPKRAFAPVNIIEDKVDMLTGYQRQNRTEIHYLPSEKGDSVAADVLNIIAKKILNNCNYQREKSDVFEDQVVVGRGLFNVGEEYESDLLGNPIVERFQWDEAYLGPHDKPDASDCEIMFKTKWYTEQGIRTEFEELLKKEIGEDEKVIEQSLEPSEDWDQRLSTMNLIDKNKKKYKLIERIKKEYQRNEILVSAEDGYAYNPVGWEKKYIEAAKRIQGITSIKRKTSRIKVTKIVSTVFLEEYYMNYNDINGNVVDENYFELVPVYGKKRKDRWWSKIEGIKDLQLVIIKVFSQFIDLVAQVRNGTVYYDSNTFDDVNDERDFKENATAPGHVQKVSNIEKRPQRDEGIRFPNEIINAIQMFSQQAREIFNVNLGMQGQDQSESGILLKQKIVQQLIGNDFLFDNMKFAEKQIAKILIKKIQKLYTPERMLRILVHENELNKKDQQKSLQIGGRAIDDYPKEELIHILKTANLADVDIDVGEAPDSPSAMVGTFLMLLEAAKTGAAIPPDMFIELYPMPDRLKNRMLESLQAAQQAQAQSEDKKYATEIEKTKIAHAGQGNRNDVLAEVPNSGGMLM